MCGFDGCDKALYAKGYCQGHYKQMRDGRSLVALRPWGQGLSNNRWHRRAQGYGMSADQLTKMLEGQGNCCELCEKSFGPDGFRVDHDHGCCPGQYACGGCVRGLLCNDCNTSLGKFGDDPEMLLRAAEYLLRRRDLLKECI